MTDLPTVPGGSTEQGRKTNGLALAGMILGIISLPALFVFGLGFLCAIAGLILSVIGLAVSGRVGAGKGQAIAGLILSGVGIVALPLLGVIIWFWTDISG